MSNIQEIRHHISVVKDTSKITNAMYLISSAKMKKAIRMHEQNLAYFQKVRSLIKFILENSEEDVVNPYFERHPGGRAAYLVIAADKGLCGSYNQEILKLAEKTMRDGGHKSTSLFTIGYVASEYFARIGMNPDVHYLHVIQDPNLDSARAITYELCDLFRKKMFDEVYVVYTQLEKGILQPVVMRLLPILDTDFAGVQTLHKSTGNLVYHPSPSVALEEIAPHYLVGLVYSTLVQAYAAEQRARMTAMESATDNAKEMLSDLQINLNHARQSLITQELTEIISGAEQALQ